MKKTTLFKSLLAMTIAFAGSKSFADNYVQITSIDDLPQDLTLLSEEHPRMPCPLPKTLKVHFT